MTRTKDAYSPSSRPSAQPRPHTSPTTPHTSRVSTLCAPEWTRQGAHLSPCHPEPVNQYPSERSHLVLAAKDYASTRCRA
eukprot:gene11305-18942_t